MKLLFSLLLSILTISGFCQIQNFEECSIPPMDTSEIKSLPWYGNNKMLDNFRAEKQELKMERKLLKEKLKMSNQNGLYGSNLSLTSTLCDPYDYLIPVRVVVWQDADDNEHMTSQLVEAFLAETNERYRDAGASIQFYLVRSPVFKTNSFYASGWLSDADEYGMWLEEMNEKQFTIHFNGGGGSHGSGDRSNIVWTRSCLVRTDGDGLSTTALPYNINHTEYIEKVGGVLAHELGHVLGLRHTHDAARLSTAEYNGSVSNGCYQESVSRAKKNYWYDGCTSTNNEKKCEINGDQLCDTEADPNMGFLDYEDDPDSPNGCSYTLKPSGDYRTDNWGALWNPNPLNIMGYSNQRCRRYLSPNQIAIAHYRLDTKSGSMSNNITLSSSKNKMCYLETATVTLPSSFGDDYPDVYNGTYTWTVGNGLSIDSGQGTKTLTVKANSSTFRGLTEVAVTINTPYGSFCQIKDIYIGVPPAPNLINGPSSVCPNSLHHYYTGIAPYATSYLWSVDGNGWSVSNQNSTFSTINIGNSSGYVRVQSQNSCGSSNYKYLYVNVSTNGCSGGGCDPILAVSPNPSIGGDLDVQILRPAPCPITLNTGYDVYLYDQEGNVIYSNKETNDRFNINNKGLKRGLYYLKVIIGRETVLDHKIMIN